MSRRSKTIAALALVVTATAWLHMRIRRERITPLATLNPHGQPRALLSYHAAFDGFQREVSEAFSQGLVKQGGRLDRTTTSGAAPANLDPYDLLVLGVETYWFAPDRPTERYLRRLGGLHGKPVAVLLTGAGETRRAERLIRERLEEAGANVMALRSFWILRPNDESDPRSNRVVALDQAERLGRELATLVQEGKQTPRK